ncbi:MULTISPECIES: SDR family NAD(P)-dependent oxidoreductase [unclassified Rhodococcus (in: high G+C Gram-positive bacteria)]|uniref:SDR family NAD(P)-dependent oxidoreductase n=1 Tax=unclassified Rhodococcus (in: high G+C Gram-positive bacteria) TaxID=192944 RepID=UPI001639CC2D|nr:MULTISPECIES: glucose 1-dehydrogenase [unclassified Rhodococcus (in: high G+C Gram-positive bacteria)]MBC2637771.1 glucose 1-dehydrogenase [Rhodococcus sp. 3A]MBC2897484.1 glucose 1-dehydrogenase [Rhodococcus sp. 4CII]
MGRLAGKVAIISGGARGIGRAAAELFAEEGAKVVVGDVREPEGFEHADITFHPLDVTRLESWGSLVDSVISAHGRIDILVNNAGLVGSYEPIGKIDVDDWHNIIEVNQTGVFYGMRSVIPTMQAQHAGAIVNVSSIWGIVGAAGVSAYQASKAAVRMMSKNAALSYVDDGIRVNSLHPGLASTPMIAAQDDAITADVIAATPMKRAADPREIAYGALFLASDEASYITGIELPVDGGYTAP